MTIMPSTEPFFSDAKIFVTSASVVARRSTNWILSCEAARAISAEEPLELDHFGEDLQPFVLKLPHVVRDARQVAAGPGDALHEAGGDRIAHVGEYHRDLGRRGFGRADCLVLEGDEQIDSLTDEGSRGFTRGVLVRQVPIVEMDVSTLLVAQLLEALA